MCVHVCMFVCVCACECSCACVYVCGFVCMYVSVFMCECVHMCLCVCVHLCCVTESEVKAFTLALWQPKQQIFPVPMLGITCSNRALAFSSASFVSV